MNLGNPNEFTIKALAHQVLELTQSSSTIEYRPLPKDDPRRRQPDISKARQLLQFEPKTPLREGLLKLIEDFRGRLQASKPSTRPNH